MYKFTVAQIADEFGHDSLDDCLVKAIDSIETIQKNDIDFAIILAMRQHVQVFYFDAILKIMAA